MSKFTINNSEHLIVPSTTKVSAKNNISIVFPSGEVEELTVNIEADFKDLNPKHHELFLNAFASKYSNDTKVWNTHTNHDGSRISIVEGNSVKPKSNWFKRLFG